MVAKLKRFNSDKVPMSHHLVPLSDKQKARQRKANGIKSRFASDVERVDVVNKEREYYAPIKPGFKPCRVRARHGRGYVGLGGAKRTLVEKKQAERLAFLRALGARV